MFPLVTPLSLPSFVRSIAHLTVLDADNPPGAKCERAAAGIGVNEGEGRTGADWKRAIERNCLARSLHHEIKFKPRSRFLSFCLPESCQREGVDFHSRRRPSLVSIPSVHFRSPFPTSIGSASEIAATLRSHTQQVRYSFSPFVRRSLSSLRFIIPAGFRRF